MASLHHPDVELNNVQTAINCEEPHLGKTIRDTIYRSSLTLQQTPLPELCIMGIGITIFLVTRPPTQLSPKDTCESVSLLPLQDRINHTRLFYVIWYRYNNLSAPALNITRNWTMYFLNTTWVSTLLQVVILRFLLDIFLNSHRLWLDKTWSQYWERLNTYNIKMCWLIAK